MHHDRFPRQDQLLSRQPQRDSAVDACSRKHRRREHLDESSGTPQPPPPDSELEDSLLDRGQQRCRWNRYRHAPGTATAVTQRGRELTWIGARARPAWRYPCAAPRHLLEGHGTHEGGGGQLEVRRAGEPPHAHVVKHRVRVPASRWPDRHPIGADADRDPTRDELAGGGLLGHVPTAWVAGGVRCRRSSTGETSKNTPRS